MPENKIISVFKQAPLPASLTILSFALFLAAYWIVTQMFIQPYYWAGLLFSLPFFCFAGLTLLTVRRELKAMSVLLSVLLLIAFGISMGGTLLFISIDAATNEITDIAAYERVLKRSHYRNQLLERCFPSKIPENAANVKFLHRPAMGQGGKDTALQFETDASSLKSYEEIFSKKAVWSGRDSDAAAAEHGVYAGALHPFDRPDTDAAKRYDVYVMFSKPYLPGNWNHGEYSLVAVSEQENKLLFLASDW